MASRPTITCPGCGEQLYLHPMDGWEIEPPEFPMNIEGDAS